MSLQRMQLTTMTTGGGVHQRLYFGGTWLRAVLISPRFTVRLLIISTSPSISRGTATTRPSARIVSRACRQRRHQLPLPGPDNLAVSEGEAPSICARASHALVTIKPPVPDSIQLGKRTAKRAVGCQQAAIRSMIFIGRLGDGTKGFKFSVQFYRRHNIIAHVVGDMRNHLFCFHHTNFSPVL